MRDVPEELQTGVFSRRRARELDVTSRMLEGRRFVRVLPRVYRLATHEMTPADWTRAAALALPDRARLTGISRLQALGLDFGPRLPVRYVVEGDLHLTVPQVFLHRTKRMPPLDDVGVRPDAAFLAYCARARVVDAIKVGDWLLHHGHVDLAALQTSALAQLWRAGADETLWILDHLDPGSRSLMESELRAVLTFSGLPRPEVNGRLELEDEMAVIADLLYRRWRLAVEYEGRHHQTDRARYSSDLDRYALLRAHGVGYIQVTGERLHHARTLVGTVYRELLVRGYDGPAPVFGERWDQLFGRLSAALGPRRLRRAG